MPESFSEFLSDVKSNQYDDKTFAIRLKATVSDEVIQYLLPLSGLAYLEVKRGFMLHGLQIS